MYPHSIVDRYEIQLQVYDQKRQADDHAGNTQRQKGERIKKLLTLKPRTYHNPRDQ